MNAPETEPEISESPICLVPGHLFFIQTIELPADLSPEETQSFAELSLEARSPFPLEQLHWGSFLDRDAEQLLIYATHQDRLKQMGYKDLKDYTWVLPDFISILGHSLPPEEYLLSTELSIASVQFSKSAQLPESVTAFANEDPQAPQVNDNTFELLESTLVEKETLQFEIATPSEGSSHTVQFDESVLWKADIRSPEFKINARRLRKLSQYLNQGFKWAVGVAALLLFAEVVLFGCNFWLDSKNSVLAEQAQPVAKIQEQQALTIKLEQVFGSELRPVAMLEKLNQLRPEGIYFDETSSSVGNEITIEGVAQSINELNNYTSKLRESGQFKLIKSPKAITRSGQTTFSVQLTYTHEESPEPADSPAPSNANNQSKANAQAPTPTKTSES